MSIAHTVSVS